MKLGLIKGKKIIDMRMTTSCLIPKLIYKDLLTSFWLSKFGGMNPGTRDYKVTHLLIALKAVGRFYSTLIVNEAISHKYEIAINNWRFKLVIWIFLK